MALRQGCRSSLFDLIFRRRTVLDFAAISTPPLNRNPPPIPMTPLPLKSISVGNQVFQIASHPAHFAPAHPAPTHRAATDNSTSKSAGSDPYWGLLWESSIELAILILSHPWPQSASCIELGCGPGLAGIAAASAGLQVTLTDLMPDAVQLALQNAAANGISTIVGQQLDWKSPPQQPFDVILASDVLYESDLHQDLLNTISHLSHHRSVIWIGDPGRESARGFLRLVDDHNWSYRLRSADGHELIQPQRSRFQLIELLRPRIPAASGLVPPLPPETNTGLQQE